MEILAAFNSLKEMIDPEIPDDVVILGLKKNNLDTM